MRVNKNTISIKNIIIFIFVFSIFLSTLSIGGLIFNQWSISTKKTTEKFALDIIQNIDKKIQAFLYVPYHINEVNHLVLENKILDINNVYLRDKFFVGVLNAHNDEIYSFSYGTKNGEYYGARRNEDGSIEIMHNDETTGGNSWYYTVDNNMIAGDLVLKAGKFDPRTRDWYKVTVESKEPSFSSIYKHFVKNDLTLSSAWPIYNQSGELEGVLGTHLLLSNIDKYLLEAVKEYNGKGVIIEKDTGYIISSTIDIKKFNVLSDNSIKRMTLYDLKNDDIIESFEKYKEDRKEQIYKESKDGNKFINIKEIKMNGVDWLLLTSIPEVYFIGDIIVSKTISIYLAIFIFIILLGWLLFLLRKLLKPLDTLLNSAYAMSTGDLSQRVEIVRNDEIGLISNSFNKVADKLQSLIDNLEEIIKERTLELNETNLALEESKDELRLILDSSAEGVYGMDLDGNCTFCNVSCLNLLGYSSQNDLIGKNMHYQIHYKKEDGASFPIEECRILQSIETGNGVVVDNEVFWKADGTPIKVEYRSYPQVKNGKVIGGVVTFMDITERKEYEAEIQRLSFHDSLTGLYNRRYFESIKEEIDVPENMPISIIFADMNGLKMTNDIFGHALGDQLINKSSEILMDSCRKNDIIARVGGDEFILLLPNTSRLDAEKILERIKTSFKDARVEAIKCSISLGLATKTSVEETLEEIMTNAENEMYREKTLNRKDNNRDILNTLIDTLHGNSPKEGTHSARVSELSVEIGEVLNLSDSEINKLKRAGFLHDIGKVALNKELLLKDTLSDEEYLRMQQHSVIGYRILSLFDETLDLAEYVYSHHERWDGRGYPRGLSGLQIPLISRIISVAETYQRVLSKNENSYDGGKKAAMTAVIEDSGTKYDPEIVKAFIRLMEDKTKEE